MEIIHAYSIDPVYNPIALKDFVNHFRDPTNVNAFFNQLEAWRLDNNYDKQSFVSFAFSNG